ncbi:MAG: hypothetical protein IJI44_06590 [Erysipelotrichaceae bacterium]|nr:hypothetical protein [Erysipelotrichaceae bacterium]
MENEKKYLPDRVESYEELKNIFEEFHIDSEKTRFFIGDDYTDPKAFVIYQDDFGDYVVYKMKADGTRALRYKGPNEKIAVSEYYQKFLEEVRKRPLFARKLIQPERTRSYYTDSRGRKHSTLKVALIGILGSFLVTTGLIFGVVSYQRRLHKNDGYYVTPSGTYYTQGHDVYYYDNDDWYYYGPYDTFYDDYYDDYTYYDDYYYNDSYTDFYDSHYYSGSSSYSSSDYDDDDYDYDDYDSGWDDDDDWDSWDSGGSDWDSDW